MNTEDKQQRPINKWDRGMIQQIKDFEDWKPSTTIPVDVKIQAEHKVLDHDKAIGYLVGAKTIYKLECICRMMMGNCDLPTGTCIAWDTAKPLLETDIYKNQNTREISKEETIETLKMSHEAGLVHIAYAMWDDKVNGFAAVVHAAAPFSPLCSSTKCILT